MNRFIQKRSDQIVIAVPSKGRIKNQVLAFLQSKGCAIKPPEGRELQSCLENDPSHLVVFMHARDIALMVQDGVVDIGFTGMDLILDTGADVRPVIRLNCGKVTLALLVPSTSSAYHPFHLLHKTVASPFPNLAKAYFDRLQIDVAIRPIEGAAEGMPYLGVVDGIVDVVETGETARENGLKIIADDLFESEYVAIVKQPEWQSNHHHINAFLRKMYA